MTSRDLSRTGSLAGEGVSDPFAFFPAWHGGGEEERQGEGLREFIRILRLLEDYPMDRLQKAVEKALVIHAHSRDAVLQFLVPRFSWRNTTCLLDGRKHLRLVKVGTPDLSAYRNLLAQEVRHDGKG